MADAAVRREKYLLKMEKKSKKREKKKGKHLAKREKQLNKLRAKRGIVPEGEEEEEPEMVFEDVTEPVDDAPAVEVEWTRRSTTPMAEVERKIDRIFETKRSSIKDLWEQKYGESLELPQAVRDIHYTDADRERLQELRAREPTIEVAAEEEEEYVPVKAKKKRPKAKKGQYPIWDIRCLILRQKLVKPDTNVLVKLILLLIDIILWILLLILIRWWLFPIMLIIGFIRNREPKPKKAKAKKKSKKAKKAKKAKKGLKKKSEEPAGQ